MHCGTSLLHQIISRHDSIYCERKELKFLDYLAPIKQRFPDLNDPTEKRRYMSFCAGVIKNSVSVSKSLDEIPCNPSDIEGFTITGAHDHLSIFFDVFSQLASSHSYWLEGTPNSVFYHREIRERLPDAKFIIIVRDIRDVLASKKKRHATTNSRRYGNPDVLKRKKLEKDYSCVLDALSWRSTYATCKSVQTLDRNTFVLRYEDLTAKPQSTVEELCRFLNISYDDELLSIAFSNSADTEKIKSGIYQNSGMYRKQLKGRELAVAQSINKDLMKWYQYKIEPASFIHTIGSVREWSTFGVQLLKRLWNRYRLMKKDNFRAFLQFNLIKLKRGILRSG